MKNARSARVTTSRDSITLRSELARLFPNGTRDQNEPDWSEPPQLPVELFGAVGYLLEASSAYTYIVAPFTKTREGGPDVSYRGATQAPAEEEVIFWRKVGVRWAANVFKPQPSVHALWRKLWACREEVFVVGQATRPRLSWWKPAHALLIIADEASCNCGYETFAGVSAAPNWGNKLASHTLISRTQQLIIPSGRSRSDERHLSRHVSLDSLAVGVARNVVRVLPKGRTTDVGCTMRTLSHNLTLVRPHGNANVYWHQQLWTDEVDRQDKLNILLVPFPYAIPDGCFQGDTHNGPADIKWGRFRIEQKWLSMDAAGTSGRAHIWSSKTSRASFVAFLDELIRTATKSSGPVQGVVLPEYALDWTTYDEVVRHLRDKWPAVEFLISGVSEDCNERRGNQVLVSVMHDEDGQRIAETHSRRKHHRWRIDDTQIRGYRLESDLSTGGVWWEYLEIEDRVLHLDVFRSQSAFTAVVCEDLARADPVVSEIRSLGPNLIFALLMDGPQTKSRWPGQYATSLADDPGSSVLTLTSFGLIERSNAYRRNKKKPESRSIGIWRNRSDGTAFSKPETDFVELNLPAGSQAMVVSLRSSPALDVTIDGRQDRNTTAWYFEQSAPVSIPFKTIDEKGWRWIVRS